MTIVARKLMMSFMDASLLSEVTIDERFVESLCFRDVVEALLDDVLLDLLEVLNVLIKTIPNFTCKQLKNTVCLRE